MAAAGQDQRPRPDALGYTGVIIADIVARQLNARFRSRRWLRWTRSAAELPERVWNVGLPSDASIRATAAWPLFLLPLLLAAQLVAPSVIWTGLFVGWLSLYLFAYVWVRSLLPAVSLTRTVADQAAVVGDVVEFETVIANDSVAPLVWCRLEDRTPSRHKVVQDRVVSCAGQAQSRWTQKHRCRRRGLFRFGPTRLVIGEPVGLFTGCKTFAAVSEILIYPRVAALPETALPQQSRRGSWQHRRRLQASVRSPAVRAFVPSDSLRFIHWPSSARQGALMVTERESEPGTRITAVLNLYRDDHVGEGMEGTLEIAVMAAASLVAQTAQASDQRQCGLLCAEEERNVTTLPPGQGTGHLWAALRALAVVGAGAVPLHRLLGPAQGMIRFQQEDSVLVITPYPDGAAASPARKRQWAWLSELNALRQRGIDCGIVLIRHPRQATLPDADALRAVLDAFPVTVLDTDARYEPLITYRRRRTEFITTPSGGASRVEVEEVVG